MSDFADATWRKSIRSSGQHDQCVEVARIRGTVGIRDSKEPAGPVLVFARPEVAAFLAAVKSDRLDP
ncbi:DUF397 domain-containing protein [Actinomadura scrupuli]|uniref:DUF397 domain-containing protein n=1 Tax=Actinomadura scrupuli TaxID=559629 RepID=UPI003D955040